MEQVLMQRKTPVCVLKLERPIEELRMEISCALLRVIGRLHNTLCCHAFDKTCFFVKIYFLFLSLIQNLKIASVISACGERRFLPIG